MSMFELTIEQQRYQRHWQLREVLFSPSPPQPLDFIDFLFACLMLIEFQHLEMLRYYDYRDPPAAAVREEIA